MRVYAVEKGSYSDYRVVALFLNQEDAERAATVESGEVVAREVYELYPEPTTYYVIDNVPSLDHRPPAIRSLVIQAWDGPYWEGRMVNGVAFNRWAPNFVRVWGTDREGVRRRWQEYWQETESEENWLK